MECRQIQEQLPAYLDGALPGGEEGLVAVHLASCAKCAAARDDLLKAARLVGSLDEVEAPPWLKSRVMARVREARARQARGFWRRLSPFGLRLPAAAVASLLIAGIAVYVFKAMEPDVPPLRHAAKQRAEAPAQKEGAAPEAEPPSRAPEAAAPAPAAPPAERPAEQLETKPAPRGRAPAAGPPVALEPPPAAAQPAERLADRAGKGTAVPEVATPPASPPAAFGPPPAAAPTESYRKDLAIREMEEATGRPMGSSAARKDERDEPHAAPGIRGEAPGKALVRRPAPGIAQASPYGLSLQASDLVRTAAEVQAILAAHGARSILPIVAERSATVAAEIQPAEIPDVQRKLRALGSLRESGGAPPAPDGPIRITIHIHNEP
jgi:hypothetical protein